MPWIKRQAIVQEDNKTKTEHGEIDKKKIVSKDDKHLKRGSKGEIMCLRSLVDWLILAPRDGKRSAERKLLCFLASILYSSTQNLSKKFLVQEIDIFFVLKFWGFSLQQGSYKYSEETCDKYHKLTNFFFSFSLSRWFWPLLHQLDLTYVLTFSEKESKKTNFYFAGKGGLTTLHRLSAPLMLQEPTRRLTQEMIMNVKL